jgi:hypothetical protein
MAKKGKTHIRESWKNTSKKGNNLGQNSSLGRNSIRRHCVLGQNSGVWVVFIGRALLVSAGVSQPIQKIIGISCITSADTINEIFGIRWITLVDTNNVPGIRGVPPPTRNPNRSEIWFCVVRLPTLDAACSLATAAASLHAAAPDPWRSAPGSRPPDARLFAPIPDHRAPSMPRPSDHRAPSTPRPSDHLTLRSSILDVVTS